MNSKSNDATIDNDDQRTATEFALNEDALPAFLGRMVDEHGVGLGDFSDSYLPHEGLDLLYLEALEADLIRAPEGFDPSDIGITPVAGYGCYALVTLALGEVGLHISRWAIEIDDRPAILAGDDAVANLRECLDCVIRQANALLPFARAATKQVAPLVARGE